MKELTRAEVDARVGDEVAIMLNMIRDGYPFTVHLVGADKKTEYSSDKGRYDPLKDAIDVRATLYVPLQPQLVLVITHILITSDYRYHYVYHGRKYTGQPEIVCRLHEPRTLRHADTLVTQIDLKTTKLLKPSTVGV